MNIVGNAIVLIGLVMVSVVYVCIVSNDIVIRRMHDKFEFRNDTVLHDFSEIIDAQLSDIQSDIGFIDGELLEH